MKRAAFVLILLALVGAGCGTNTAKFEPAWEAGKAVESATAVGVTYVNFGPLLGKFAAEVAIIPSGDLSGAERDIYNDLTAAVMTYQTSYEIWQKGIGDDGIEAKLQEKWSFASQWINGASESLGK